MMGTLLKKELREQWRTYRILIVAAVLVLMGLASPLLARYTPELLQSLPGMPPELAALMPTPTLGYAVGEYLDNLTQFGVILALLVPMGVVVQEKERGTAAMLLCKPVARGAFLLAKFVALTVTFTAGLFLAALGCYYYCGLLFEKWANPALFALLNAFLLLNLLVYVALTLLASTLMRSQVAAGGTAFGFFAVLWALGAIPQLGPYLPGQLISWGHGLLLESLGEPVPGFGGIVSAAGPIEPAWAALGIALGLIAVTLVGAWVSLRRQEI